MSHRDVLIEELRGFTSGLEETFGRCGPVRLLDSVSDELAYGKCASCAQRERDEREEGAA